MSLKVGDWVEWQHHIRYHPETGEYTYSGKYTITVSGQIEEFKEIVTGGKKKQLCAKINVESDENIYWDIVNKTSTWITVSKLKYIG